MKKIFRSFALVTATAVITRFLSFLFKIYLSRKLGAEVLGIYQIASSVVMLLACFGASGIPVTLSRMCAENAALGKKSDSLLSAGLTVSLILALLSCFAFVAFPSLSHAVFKDERCIPIFYIMLPLTVTSAAYACLRGWFWGNRKYGVYSLSELTDEGTKIVFSVVLLSGAAAFVSVQNAYAVAMLASDVAVVFLLCICYFVSGGRPRRARNFAPVLKSSVPLTITRVSGSFIAMFVSLTLPALLSGRLGMSTGEATAELGRATGMVMPLLFAPSALTGSLAIVLIPEIATMHAKNMSDKISATLALALKFSCLAGAFFFMFFASSGKVLGDLLYSDPKAGEYLRFAAVLMLPMSANGLCVSTLNSMGKETDTFIAHLISYAVLIVLIFATVPFIGIYGYFVSMFASFCVGSVVNFSRLFKVIKLPKKELFQSFAVILFSATGAFSLAPLCDLLQERAGLFASAAVILIICAVSFALFVVFSKIITKNDFAAIFRKKQE